MKYTLMHAKKMDVAGASQGRRRSRAGFFFAGGGKLFKDKCAEG
jgi:hypothetical protein